MKKGVIIAVLAGVLLILAALLFLSPKGQDQSSQGAEQPSKTNIAMAETSPPESPSTLEKEYLGIAGGMGKIKGRVSPTNGKKVKGIIEVSLTELPEKTDSVRFGLIPSGTNPAGPELVADTDGSDGWSVFLDTNTEVNGLYDIIVLAQSSERSPEQGPLDYVKAQVIVEN